MQKRGKNYEKIELTKKLKKSIAVGLLCTLTLSALAGCGSSETADGADTTNSTDTATADTAAADATADEGQAASGAGIDLNLISASAIATLDTTLATSAENLEVVKLTTEGLYKYNENGELELGLASEENISDDGLIHTFTIKDTKWSNGAQLTAYDFEYGWKRLANPEVGSEYAYLLFVAGVKNAYEVCYGGGNLDDLGVKAIDEKTLEVELDRPIPYLADLLTFPNFGPLSQEYLESQGEQYAYTPDNTIAIGPFKITEWEAGTGNVVLTKNPDYYDADAVSANTITFREITDTQQQVLSWESGDSDRIKLTGDYVLQYKDDPAYSSILSARVAYIAPNFNNEYLQNINLRYAIALSFDKDSIANNILKDGSIAQNFAIPEEFAADENGVSFREAAGKTYLETDKELAKEYFAKAVEELGTSDITLELLYDESEDLNLIAQFIKQELETNLEGITINLKTQPKPSRVELMKAGDFDLGISFWGADYQDASTFLDLWTTENGYNYGHYSNPEYDELENAVSAELANDNAARIQNMIKAEEVILNDVGIIPVYQVGSAVLLNPDYNFVKTTKGLYAIEYTSPK